MSRCKDGMVCLPLLLPLVLPLPTKGIATDIKQCPCRRCCCQCPHTQEQ